MRVRVWTATVVATTAAGLVAGRLVGVWMAGFSPDYPGSSADFASLGLRLGAATGCLLAACQVVGRRPPSSGLGAIRSAAVAFGATLAIAGTLMALLYVDEIRSLYARHLLQVRLDGLVSPRRYAIYRALPQAALVGAASGAALGGATAWRRRGDDRVS